MILNQTFLIKELVFIITVLNLITYCLTLFSFFSLFFLLNLNFLKNLNELKIYSQVNFFLNINVFVFLSLAGLPPFLGFFNKFFLFFFLFNNFNIFYFSLFLFLNCFSIYFYIQNLKSLVSKKVEPASNYINNTASFNFSITFLVILVQFFLIFGVFFLSDFLILLTPLHLR